MTFEERMEAIDRRLERLTERHEALAQTLELLIQENKETFREIALRFRDTRDTIEGLARIAGVHQERLDEPEERLDNLEK